MFLSRSFSRQEITCPECGKSYPKDSEDGGTIEQAGICLHCYAIHSYTPEPVAVPAIVSPIVVTPIAPLVVASPVVPVVPVVEPVVTVMSTPVPVVVPVVVTPVVAEQPVVPVVTLGPLLHYDDRMEWLRNNLSSTSKAGLTYNLGKNSHEDLIIGHIFGGPYDLWVQSYDEENEEFFGFASFGGIHDQDAEWGYASLQEFLEMNKTPSLKNVERDFYWDPKTLKELQDENKDNSDLVAPPFKLPEQDLIKPPAPAVVVKQYQKYPVSERTTDIEMRKVYNAAAPTMDKNWVYQNFSGLGKLHDLEFKDFGSFHDYTKAKQEFELGQFFTPDHLCKEIVGLVSPLEASKVIDITCGMGRFFNYIENEKNCYGFEESTRVYDVATSLFPRATIYNWSMKRVNSTWRNLMDYSVGNPPFNITFSGYYDHPLATDTDEEDGGKGNILSQNLYLDLTYYYLKEGGIACFIVPATWLGPKDKKANSFIKEKFNFIATFDLPEDTFSEYGINFHCKVVLMQKRFSGSPNFGTPYNGTIQGFRESHQFQYFLILKKELDDINRNKKFLEMKETAVKNDTYNNLYYKALDCVIKFRAVSKQKTFDTPNQMINSILDSCQYRMPVEEKFAKIFKKFKIKGISKYKNPENFIKIVKNDYSITIEHSNPKVKDAMNYIKIKYDSVDRFGNPSVKERYVKLKYEINELIVNDESFEQFKHEVAILKAGEAKIDNVAIPVRETLDVIKLIERKRKLYQLNSMDTAKLKELPQYEENLETLEDMEFDGKKLLPHQKEDLAGLLLKRYGLISHDTGLGKTLTGMVWAKMKGGKTLIVCPAVNVLDPWGQQLKQYLPEKTVLVLKKAKDIYKYKGEDFLVISLEGLPGVSREIRRIHFHNLIVDESDNVKSKASVRFKELRVLARKIKNKIMMTGTPTRNNVNEIYNQIELMCNNSVNMLCYADKKIEYDRSYREWREKTNGLYMQPFPAWGGHKQFTETFSPKKITCFGAAETNQDIFQKDALNKLIQSVRFTRDFDTEMPRINEMLKIENKGIYKEYKQILVPMSEIEQNVYEYILTEFAAKMEDMHRQGALIKKEDGTYQVIHSHDSQVSHMLVIMRQILELLQGTSHPWTFKDMDGKALYPEGIEKTSTKLDKAFEIITEAFKNGSKVMMASPWRDTAEEMERKAISKGLSVYRINAEMSKTKRAALVTAFRNHVGPALITGTMGCLKSGLNLPEVSVVIAESYPWNFAQLHQYAARAIRLNSVDKTTVYCLCSEGSFDVNVFALLLKKEVVNKFVRTSEDVDVEDITESLGSSGDMFSSALQMVRERVDGRTRGRINWGAKAISTN